VKVGIYALHEGGFAATGHADADDADRRVCHVVGMRVRKDVSNSSPHEESKVNSFVSVVMILMIR